MHMELTRYSTRTRNAHRTNTDRVGPVAEVLFLSDVTSVIVVKNDGTVITYTKDEL